MNSAGSEPPNLYRVDLRKPPWSSQKVHWLVRWGAWFFVACAAIAGIAAIYFVMKEGIPQKDIPAFVGILVGEAYITALFLHVGLHGRAPTGWIPLITRHRPSTNHGSEEYK